jgi:hypothetical protein
MSLGAFMMSSMSKERDRPDIANLEWAILQRANIQRTLLALYDLARRSSLEGGLPSAESHSIFIEPYAFDHFIAAAFSLWRAVFLTDADRSWRVTRRHQEEFLEKLLTTNTIAFADDYKSRAWTVRFYLEAAKARLVIANGFIGHHLPDRQLPPVEPLLRVSGEEPAQTRYEWEALHRALRILLKVVDPQMALPIDELMLPTE